LKVFGRAISHAGGAGLRPVGALAGDGPRAPVKEGARGGTVGSPMLKQMAKMMTQMGKGKMPGLPPELMQKSGRR